MSSCLDSKVEVALYGAGCASLSLAARAGELGTHKITVIAPPGYGVSDHVWGFWDMPWLAQVADKKQKTWQKWRIITEDRIIEHRSTRHPYAAISRHRWIEACTLQAKHAGVKFIKSLPARDNLQILDSRPPAPPSGCMIQHFRGYEIVLKDARFDASTAILMDFRCDQSRGIHFIYCLPFSPTRALVESTLFSTEIESPDYYDKSIRTYLADVIGVSEFTIDRQESGAIPMALLGRFNPLYQGIGSNGGAIRPSSGYAFSFIQKQVGQILRDARAGQHLVVKSPHSRFTLLMDQIFLRVLHRYPTLAPRIFINMASVLTGDEFARFLSSEGTISTWMKVIFAMPKLPFIRVLFPTFERG